jgi:tRNA-specific 2-thiouridylase
LKIAVLTSGGVDSAYSLISLKEKGYDVTAHYIKIWNPQYEEEGLLCPWRKDIQFVEQLCNQFHIELKVHNLQLDYEFTVLEYMLSELKRGGTPNPDILCNYFIKFGIFFEHISFNEYNYVASGHYATKLNNDDEHIYWHKSDPKKDQSFFLSKLKPNQVKKIIFPCSGLNKSEIREAARQWNLPQKDRKDSQGLCFLGNINYSEFISRYIPIKKGHVYNLESSELIGEHDGIHLYTEGQRIGISNPHGPWYVYKKDIKNNAIYVINRQSFHKHETSTLPISDIVQYEKHVGKQVYLKIRHPQEKLIKGTISSFDKISLEDKFKPFQFSPGQIISIYEEDNFGYKLISSAKITR